MKLVLFMLGICIGVMGIEIPAQAQNYPWCALYMNDGVMNCGFATFQQCLAEINGPRGFCTQNSTYQPPQVPRPRARRTRSSLR
jgi:hypothetical protein